MHLGTKKMEQNRKKELSIFDPSTNSLLHFNNGLNDCTQ